MTMILEREEKKKEETFVSEFDFSVFVMLEFSMGKNGWLPGIFDKTERYALFFCFGLFASSVIKSLKT